MNLMRIDFRKLVVSLLPTFLRQPKMLAIMRAIAQPLVTLSDRRLSIREDTLFQLQHNGQVCYLKDALNHYFGLTDYANGFQIEDVNAQGNYVMAYDETEQLDAMQWVVDDENMTIIYDENVINVATVSFTVLIPSSLYTSENLPKIRRIVEQYRLVSRLPQYKKIQQ